MIVNAVKKIQKHNSGYVSPMTGRRRALSDGAMIDICTGFANGRKVKDLAADYGISTSTVYHIVYWTPRKEK